MDQTELLWRQYELNNQMYRGYLELVVRLNVFYYAITGAILSFYFAHSEDFLVKWSLLLPFAMSLSFAAFFLYGAFAANVTRTEVFAIRDKLGLTAAPEHAVLIVLLGIFSVLFIIASVGLGWLLWVR